MNRITRLFYRTFFVCLLWSASALAHDVYLPVIIDTDAAADDIRAIAMLLNSGAADIRLIVTADGVLAPETGKKSVQRLLACLNHTEIPVINGRELSLDAPPFRALNESLNWPDCAGGITSDTNQSGTTAPAAIISAVRASEDEILYLCLGPMTNLAAAIQTEPSIIAKLHRVVYLGSAPGSEEPGWNTRRDLTAAKTVYDSGAPVYSLGLPDSQYIALNDVYPQLCAADSDTAQLMEEIHNVPVIQKKISDRHMKVWDEMTVLYINLMSAFEFVPDAGYPESRQLSGFDSAAVKDTYIRLLGNPADFHLDARKSVVLTAFPADPQMMRPDVSLFVEDIIARHGMEEWKACLLTNELHRHLGIYSLVGAKMGIRAREILEAPFDTLKVVSHAGLKPPLSCINDGLQVSTGASLGRGAIRVIEENSTPSAEFERNNIILTLTIKPEYVHRIKTDIHAAINQFGGLGPEYFAHIRHLSIRYWKEFDRTKLFEERLARKK